MQVLNPKAEKLMVVEFKYSMIKNQLTAEQEAEENPEKTPANTGGNTKHWEPGLNAGQPDTENTKSTREGRS